MYGFGMGAEPHRELAWEKGTFTILDFRREGEAVRLVACALGDAVTCDWLATVSWVSRKSNADVPKRIN